MSIETIIFYAFALITAGGGLTLCLMRNVIYAAFLLFVVLFGMAGMYVFAGAEFLAVSQVILYVGGILVILLFGVMLTHKIREANPRTEIINLIPGIAVAGGLFAVLFYMIRESAPLIASHAPRPVSDDVEAIGRATLTDYLLPFELISVLLLVVLIGAAYLTRKNPEKEEQS